MASSEQPSQFGPVETKQFREKRVNEHVAEIRRAVHDGEWSVALQEATELVDRLSAIVKADGINGEGV